ncbi:MAG: hypothetical protein RIF32_22350 [Leptospirales bacterium]
MPQNPHVRTIRLFNPAEDLAVDDANPRRARKRRPPVNPAEGLLNDDDDVSGGPAPSAASTPAHGESAVEYTRLEPEESKGPAPRAPDPGATTPGSQAGRPPEPAEKFESSVLGEVPDIIEGDFPEPVDL